MLLATNQLWQISFCQPIWNNFYGWLNLRVRLNSAKHCALIVPNWPKLQSFNPNNFTKNVYSWNIFSHLSSRQQNLLNDIKKLRQNWLVKKSKFVLRNKKPPRAQILRYFRYEYRIKKEQKIFQFFYPPHAYVNYKVRYLVFFILMIWSKDLPNSIWIAYALSKNAKNCKFIIQNWQS